MGFPIPPLAAVTGYPGLATHGEGRAEHGPRDPRVGLEYGILGLACGFAVSGSIMLRADTRW
jgi:hypothetical protein